MVWGSVISAGASLLGNKLTNRGQSSAASTANQFTEQQLKKRHQWEVQDLRKAGLNPVLSAGGTPSIGSSAQAQLKSLDPSAGIQAGSTASVANQQRKLIKEQINTELSKQADHRAGAYMKTAQGDKAGNESNIFAYSLPKFRKEAKVWSSKAGDIAAHANILGSAANSASSALNNFKPFGGNIRNYSRK